MKHFASLALLLIFAAAQVAFAEDLTQQIQKAAQQKKKPQTHKPVNTSAVTTHKAQKAPKVTTNPNYHPQTGINNPMFKVQTPHIPAVVPNPAAVIHDQTITNAANAVNHGQNWKNNPNWKNTNWKSKNWWKTNPNWQANHSKWANYHKWDRVHRDRSWWTNHYTRFSVFGGGYYYWNSGFWYPAYGYDPYFTTYSYDAPIYAVNNQEPGQVVADVQNALRQAGYDPGPVDNAYGPQTREALVRYQADTGLPDSGRIDEATLASLGLE